MLISEVSARQIKDAVSSGYWSQGRLPTVLFYLVSAIDLICVFDTHGFDIDLICLDISFMQYV